MNDRVRTALAPAVLLLALGLAACEGGADEPSGRAAETTATPTAAETTQPTEPTEPAQDLTTIPEHLAEQGIGQTVLTREDEGPVVDLPVPDGWRVTDSYADAAPYGAIVYDDAADPADPPRVLSLMARLDGEVDPATILELAPNELAELEGFVPIEMEQASTLGAYDAVQVAGSLMSEGRELVVAQKTVVVPTESGLHVLQLNAFAPAAEEEALITALTLIDARTTITP